MMAAKTLPTTARKRRYWAIRTDPDNRSILLDEVQQGRLRQGWGYDPKQDLRLIQVEITKGGSWWERLSAAQNQARRHLRMLATAEDSVQVGDWVILPNLPEEGKFLIGEVSGEYRFEPLKLSKKADVNGLGQDYGHVLPIRLLTRNGIDKYAGEVAAELRGSLKTRSRMWNLDGYSEALERLVDRSRRGVDLSSSMSGEARLSNAWQGARAHASQELQKRLGSELDARFQAEEWEEPIKTALVALYPGAEVHWVAGRNEKGADIVVQIRDPLSGGPWLVIVQVKNYRDQIGADVVAQLRTAHEHYSKEGTILSLVVMTTAEKVSNDLAAARTALSEELKVPVNIILRKGMLKILANGLMDSLGRQQVTEDADDVG